MLFVCEDNRWSATTPTDRMTAGEGALARASAIGVPGAQVDGNDVFAVDELRELSEVERERPRFLHAVTYRFKGHVSVDAAAYRDGAEVSKALENDPLLLAGKAFRNPRRGQFAGSRGGSAARCRRGRGRALAEPGDAYRDVQDTGSGQWR